VKKNGLALHFFDSRVFILLLLTSPETLSSNELLKFSYCLSQSHIVEPVFCTIEIFGQGKRYPLAARNSLLKENCNTQTRIFSRNTLCFAFSFFLSDMF